MISFDCYNEQCWKRKREPYIGLWYLSAVLNPSMNELRAVKDEFVHEAWVSGVIIAESFAVTALLYTPTDCKPSRGVGDI